MFYCDLSINRVFVIFLVTAVVCVFVIMLGPEDHRKPQLDKSYDPSTPTRLTQARMSPSHHAAARMPRDQGGKEETVLSEALCNAASMPEIARETAIKRILASACEKHPEFVAGVLRNLMISHSGKIEIALILVSRWPDTEQALDWADSNITGKDRGLVIEAALARHVLENPIGALNFIEGMPFGSPARDQAFRGMIAAWTNLDPQAVLNYSNEIYDPEVKKETRDLALWTLSNRDPAEAVKILEHRKNGGGIDGLSGDDLTALAQSITALRMANESPLSVFDWTLSLSGKEGEAARCAAIFAWADTDPGAAAERLKSLMDGERKQVAVALAAAWSRQDPVAAAAWVSSCEGKPEQARMVEEIVKNWSGSSPRDAYSWLDTLPAGSSRDKGILLLIRREVSQDPEAAFLWVEALSDSKLRESQNQVIMDHMRAADLKKFERENNQN